MATLKLSDMTRKEALLAELASSIPHPPQHVPAPSSDPSLSKLKALGTQLWLDTGNLEEASRLWKLEMTALTTNNTLANQVVQTGVMDRDIQDAASRIRDIEKNITQEDMVMDIAFVVNCHIALRLVHAFGALVSVELHPSLGYDIERTLRYAQRYYAVNPEHFIVKIPMTPEGFCAVARARAEGIPINYTLGFSARQNYLATLLSKPSYCNVFLGRLNAVVADNKLGDGRYIGEKTTLASQAGVRELRVSHPEITTQQIAASMRNADQMVELAGTDVYTIPPKALEEFYVQGHAPESLSSHLKDIYPVKFADGVNSADIELLWAIDDKFKAFARELAHIGGTKLNGDDLRRADKEHGTRLFSSFTPEEQAEIRKKGKIPEMARWFGRAALDDLMTESALQSFIVDQAALDSRIRQVAGIA